MKRKRIFPDTKLYILRSVTCTKKHKRFIDTVKHVLNNMKENENHKGNENNQLK